MIARFSFLLSGRTARLFLLEIRAGERVLKGFLNVRLILHYFRQAELSVKRDFSLLSTLNEYSWRRTQLYGTDRIVNEGEAESLFSDPELRTSLISIENGDMPDFHRGYNWAFNNVKQFNDCFGTHNTAADFEAGSIQVSGQFKHLKIGLGKRCEFTMVVPEGRVTSIVVRFFKVKNFYFDAKRPFLNNFNNIVRYFKEYFKRVDSFAEENNRTRQVGTLAIDADTCTFAKRDALAKFCRWGTMPTEPLIEIFLEIPPFMFKFYRPAGGILQGQERFCITEYGLGAELALVVFAALVRKVKDLILINERFINPTLATVSKRAVV